VAINRAIGRPAVAREHLREASDHRDRLSDRNRLLLDIQLAREANDFSRMAGLLDDLNGRFPDVVDAYPMALTLYDPGMGALPNPEKMLALTRRGVEVLPESSEARLAYGYALLGVGRSADALAEFQTDARIAPREPNPLDSMGDAYLMLGMPEKAFESYSRALGIDPTFGSRNGAAYALGMLGRYEEAIAMQPSSSAVLALLLSRAGQYRDAARALAAGIARADADEDVTTGGGLHLISAMLALERNDHTRVLQEVSRARERFVGSPPAPRRVGLLTADTFTGLVEVATGRIGDARSRLAAQAGSYRAASEIDRWWHGVLEGEIAFAAGDIAAAAAAFSAGQPSQRIFGLGSIRSLVTNNFVRRAARARVAQARGDLGAAVQIYRDLLAYTAENKWISIFEPRYVLQLARLHQRMGDRQNAVAEYRRFLELWKHADADLPELAEARAAIR
jgi:tetratricopeptide (TPR) repeat protein